LFCAIGAQAAHSLAVLDIKGDQIKPSDRITLTDYVTTEVGNIPGYRAIARDAVAKAIEQQGSGALECDDEKCFADLGGALGAEYLVTGEIGMLNGKYVCNFRLIDVKKASTRARVSESIEGYLGELTDRIPVMVRRLLSTLHTAATIGDYSEVVRFITAGADVNEKDGGGWTPLHCAASSGYYPDEAQKAIYYGTAKEASNALKDLGTGERSQGTADVVEVLLKNGADVNARDTLGETPLFLAARKGFEIIVKSLLDHGADANAKTRHGRTPLHAVADSGLAEIVTLLLARGAVADAKDQSGLTPLFYAVCKGHAKAAEILLKKGAQVNAKDNVGQTPLRKALAAGKQDMVRLLKQYGATE
jgi:ankyrin repeat protein